MQLEEPWKQSQEKFKFTTSPKKSGYTDNQIAYERGYDTQFGSFVKCGVVIINDVDVIVHSQLQGRLGMFNDITVLSVFVTVNKQRATFRLKPKLYSLFLLIKTHTV